MRYREPFTVYPRRLPSGRVVYYYQIYDDQDRRTAPRSTGRTSKGAARRFCYDLMKTDSLIPLKGRNQLFSDYAKGWWIWDECEYLAYRRARRTLSRRYADTARSTLQNHILPHFARKRLKEISHYMVERWMMSLKEKGLSNSTIRVNIGVLRAMV